MDLIKEVNPDIKDLNWIAAGQQLLLPTLRPETLIRQHAEDSYSSSYRLFLIGPKRKQRPGVSTVKAITRLLRLGEFQTTWYCVVQKSTD
jgi:hypothetical protein